MIEPQSDLSELEADVPLTEQGKTGGKRKSTKVTAKSQKRVDC